MVSALDKQARDTQRALKDAQRASEEAVKYTDEAGKEWAVQAEAQALDAQARFERGLQALRGDVDRELAEQQRELEQRLDERLDGSLSESKYTPVSSFSSRYLLARFCASIFQS